MHFNIYDHAFVDFECALRMLFVVWAILWHYLQKFAHLIIVLLAVFGSPR